MPLVRVPLVRLVPQEQEVLVSPLVVVLVVALVSPLVQGHENYYYQHLQVDSLFAVRFVAQRFEPSFLVAG